MILKHAVPLIRRPSGVSCPFLKKIFKMRSISMPNPFSLTPSCHKLHTWLLNRSGSRSCTEMATKQHATGLNLDCDGTKWEMMMVCEGGSGGRGRLVKMSAYLVMWCKSWPTLELSWGWYSLNKIMQYLRITLYTNRIYNCMLWRKNTSYTMN